LQINTIRLLPFTGLLSSRESIQDALDWLIDKHWICETEPEKSTKKHY